MACAVHHIARSGGTVVVEIDLVVGPGLTLQSVATQDGLRRRNQYPRFLWPLLVGLCGVAAVVLAVAVTLE